jgi:hypothetical protein
MDRSPIETTLDRIDQGYQPGTLAWVKRKRPKEWRKMIALETEISRVAFQGDEVELVKVLNEYEAFVLEMVKAFRTPKEEIGSLFSNLQGGIWG